MVKSLELKTKLDNYLSRYRPVVFEKGRPLFYQGELPLRSLYIKSGVVKVYNITKDGEEKIVGLESAGSLIPCEWVFDHSPVSLYYYDTFTDCEIYAVPKKEWTGFISSNRELEKVFFQRFTSYYIGATMHVHALEQARADDKVLHILQYMVLKFGKRLAANRYEINLRLTHQDISNLVGLTRETVSSVIGRLRKQKIISLRENHYIIDTDKAQRQLGESEFGTVSLRS